MARSRKGVFEKRAFPAYDMQIQVWRFSNTAGNSLQGEGHSAGICAGGAAAFMFFLTSGGLGGELELAVTGIDGKGMGAEAAVLATGAWPASLPVTWIGAGRVTISGGGSGCGCASA